MYALYVTHPEVVQDPAVPVPQWSLSPLGRSRADRFAKHPLALGLRRIVSSPETKARELADLTRAANRANATVYTIDPRGLVGGAEMDDEVDMVEWNNHVRKTQDSLRVLAEETGGTAVVNQNDFVKALKKIDAETSDYYVLGYYSSNPDPTRKRRAIEVKVKRPGANVWHRTSYTLKKPNEPR